MNFIIKLFLLFVYLFSDSPEETYLKLICSIGIVHFFDIYYFSSIVLRFFYFLDYKINELSLKSKFSFVIIVILLLVYWKWDFLLFCFFFWEELSLSLSELVIEFTFSVFTFLIILNLIELHFFFHDYFSKLSNANIIFYLLCFLLLYIS